MSEINVNTIDKATGSTLTVGAAGTTVNIAGTAGSGFPTPTSGIAASAIDSGIIATARLGSGTASSSTFLAGDQSYKTVSGTTINNNANNKVITGSGTANTLEAEARLLYDGDILTQQANGSSTEFRQTSDGGGTYYTSLVGSASGVNLYTRTASPLYLGTNNASRVIVNHTNGSLALGTSWDTWYRLQLRFNGNGGGAINLDNSETDTNGTAYIQFKQNNSAIGYISRNGTNNSVSYSTSSDYRLKDNVSYDFDATTRLKELKPARFNWKSNPSQTVDGFLAHEVSSVIPEAISGEKDAVEKWKQGEELPEGKSVGDNKLDENGDTIPLHQQIDQSKIVPLLVKTIQELEARLTALENA